MRYLKFILLIILFAGCEEYFVPDVDSANPIYAFEGYVTDQPGPYRVRVMKINSYNASIPYETVTNAKVIIQCMEDRYAIDYTLTYDTTGYYYTAPDAFTGKVGNSYRLKVITADGKEFATEYENMMASADISLITSEYAEKRVPASDGSSYYDQLEHGIQLLVSSDLGYNMYRPDFKQGNSPYYRYDCNLVFQTHQHYPVVPNPFDYYIFRPYKPQGYLYIANANEYEYNHITNKKLFFIPSKTIFAKNETLAEGVEFELQHCAVFVKVTQYSMSENQYKYWEAVADQLDNPNYIFGKIENQAVGNIKCQTDESEPALGYFCVSSVKQAYKGVSLSKYKKVTYECDIDEHQFPNLDSTVVYTSMPWFTLSLSN